MKVLFFIRSFFGGGAEKVLLDYIKGLDKEKLDITVMVRSPEGAYKEQFLALRQQGVQVRWCFDRLKPGKTLLQKAKNTLLLRLADWSVYRWPKLYYRLAIRDRFDAEIAFMHNEAASVIASSSNRKSKKLLWVHTDLRQLSSFKTYFGSRKKQGAYYRKFDKCVCVSQVAAESMRELFGIEDSVVVLHNPLDRERILRLAEEPCPLPAVLVPTVCAVGRLSREKNFSMLIHAHAALLKKGIPHRLWIVGEGPERQILEKQIAMLGVGESVTLMGFQRNPYCYVRCAHFVVLSSVYEGYPTVIMESLVLGKPVVSCCAVTGEVFGGFNCGILTENDMASLEAGLEKMLTDAELRQCCAQQAALRGQELGLSGAAEALEKMLG